MKQNSIHVTDIDSTNKKWITYKTISYIGSRLNLSSKNLNLNNISNDVQVVNVCKSKKRFFSITTTVKDVLSGNPDTILLPSTARYKDNQHEVATFDNNGTVLLYYAILPKKSKKHNMQFDYDFAKNIKKVKNSTIKKGADHNGSTGLYYSFGNKGSYEMVNNSSVGQYSTKVIKNEKKNIEFNMWCSSADDLIAEHMNNSVHALKSYIRNIPRLISPVIDTAYEMQQDHGDVNLKAMNSKESGIWMCTIALNAQTSNFHSEDDCTYTLSQFSNRSCNF